MNCPKCKTGQTRVVNTTPGPDQTRIRQRQCKEPACAYRFNTTESAWEKPRPRAAAAF